MILKLVANHPSLVKYIDTNGDLEKEVEEFEGSFEQDEVLDL
jgi:hypothetical protein